jgi:ectoine hydroxylase-related dioxygenase (phytanoyl-CoA dioxygenase family)
MAHHHQALITLTDLLSYERTGFLVRKQLLPARDVIEAHSAVTAAATANRLAALRHRVRVLVGESEASQVETQQDAERLLRRRDVGFFQHFNLHRAQQQQQQSEELATARDAVRAIALAPALAGAAAALLGAGQHRVRLYQTCAFVKEPGKHGQTNWHSDLRMAPFDTNDFLTAWVPLRAVAGGPSDSGLIFAAGSHRDFALPFWRSRAELEALDLSERGYELCEQGAMSPGDVSFHHGWLLHAAGGQPQGTAPRVALAVCYFKDGARVRGATVSASASPSSPSSSSGAAAGGGGAGGRDDGRRKGEDEDDESVADWISQVKPGAAARHPLLPVVYDGSGSGGGGGGGGGRAAGRGRGGGRGGGGGGRRGGGRGRGGGRSRAAAISAA